MPSRSLPHHEETETLAETGMRIVDRLVEERLGWIFRPQRRSDRGIDAHVEVVTDNQATGQLLAMQIKCGVSFFDESDEQGFIYRGAKRHLNYWLQHSLPVLVCICQPQTRECLWTEVSVKNAIETDRGWKTIVPFGQVLDVTYKHVLQQISGRPRAIRIQRRREVRASMAPTLPDRQFIGVIHRGGVLMGFSHVAGSDYRAMAFSADYKLYKSESFYDLENWRRILELSGVEDWEIEQALACL